MRWTSVYQTILLAVGAIALPASSADHAQPAVPGLSDDKRLYQGPHMPPGLRHRPRLASLRRRDVPYGGVIAFGDQKAACAGCSSVQKADVVKKPHHLLGIIDLDLGVHV
ncbi:hypothetical protein LPJ59_000833 [Coemansia sp. RSA 2399]|nr:hypothetical protein LPJ59_000833 [Coemansia sp. RSA 2399]KAJ1906724.1 hypothetical protein LPJ81_001194 [Coemansia sp. IMI 209127]